MQRACDWGAVAIGAGAMTGCPLATAGPTAAPATAEYAGADVFCEKLGGRDGTSWPES